MRLDSRSLLAGAAAGAAGAALGLPVVAQAISAAGWPSLAAAAALLLAAAWTLRPGRRTPAASAPVPTPPPEAMTPEEWLDATFVGTDLPARSAEVLILSALVRQVQPRRLSDPRIEALFVSLVSRVCARDEEDPRHARLTWLDLGIAGAAERGATAARGLDGFLDQGPTVRETCQVLQGRHAFDGTRILAAYHMARMRGGTSMAELAWLRSVDRGLWYAMDGLGGGGVHPEGMGLLAHYTEEQAAGGPLTDARVASAAGPLLRVALARSTATEAGSEAA